MNTLNDLKCWLHANGAIATDTEISRWTGRSQRTLRRWTEANMPTWAWHCIERASGLIRITTANGFEFWRIGKDGTVTCPAGIRYTLSELRAAQFYKQALASYRERALAAERELKLIKAKGVEAGKTAANDTRFVF